MAKTVGLDIHSRGVRAVEVSGRGRKVRVTRYLERAVTPRGGAPDPEELREALVEVFKEGRLNRNHVIASVEAHDTVVREIPLPFKSDDQIRKVIKYEAEHHLHDCDADDVVVQFTRIGETAEGANLLVFAARKEHIGRRVEAARAAGVEPLAMDLDALACFHTAQAAGLFEETPACVVLHIGHRSTELVYVVDGALRALRSVRMGTDSIVQGLARDMDVDITEAEARLRELAQVHEEQGDLLLPVERVDDKKETEKSHAELERDLFEVKRNEFLARLKREFVRSTAALHGVSGPERVLACGPGLEVPGLVELLGRRLPVPVEVFRPSERFPTRLDDETRRRFDYGGIVALGLALKGAGHDRLGVDFRQEEWKVANKFELLKSQLALTVTVLFVALFAFTVHNILRTREIREKRFDPMLTSAYQAFSTVADKYNKLGDALVPPRDRVDPGAIEVNQGRDRHLAVQRFVRALRNMRRKLYRRTGGQKGIEPIVSALKIWNDIFATVRKFHKELDYIDFETIDIRQKQVNLTVYLQSAASTDLLQNELPKLEVLQGMKLDPPGADPVGEFVKSNFRFTARRRR